MNSQGMIGGDFDNIVQQVTYGILCPWYRCSEWRYVDAGLIEGVRTLLDIQEEILRQRN